MERRAEGGVQVLATRLPVLITMLEDSNEIRRGTMGDALRAARAEIIKWSAEDAGIPELSQCGLRGSPTVVKKVFAPPRAVGESAPDCRDGPVVGRDGKRRDAGHFRAASWN